MNILFVSQYFPPEVCAPAIRVSELARHWTKQGNQVTVVTGFPNHPQGKIYPEYRSQMKKVVVKERTHNLTVIRSPLVPLPNRRSWERVVNYLSFAFSSAIVGSFLRTQSQVVIATSPQLFVGLAGLWISRIKRIPFVFEVRDLWPDSITASGLSQEGSTAMSMMRSLSQFLYNVADHIVVVTPAFKDVLVTSCGVPAGKISVVTNGVETDVFKSGPSTFREEMKLTNRFIVSYVGTIGMAHGLSVVLDAAAELKKTDPQVLFLLVGTGAEVENLKEQIQIRRLDNVKLLEPQPHSRIPEILSTSDVSLVSLKKAEVFKTVIPTKMLEAMACEIPILLAVDGQAREIMEAARAGLFVEPGNVGALCGGVREFLRDRNKARELGRNGRDYVARNLSRDQTAHAYLKLLGRLSQD